MKLGVMLVVLAGCGAAPIEPEARPVAASPVATPEPAAQASVPREACWLVWLTEGGRTTTREVCETTGEREPVEGLHMGVGGEVLSIVLRQHRVSRGHCVDDAHVADPGAFIVHGLDAGGPTGTVTVLEPWETSGVEELQEQLDILGSLGPYLVVRRTLHEYVACASHALELDEVRWVHVATGEELDTRSEVESVRIDDLAAEAGHARADGLSGGPLENGRSMLPRLPVPRMDEGFLRPAGIVPVRRAGRWGLRREVVLEVDELDRWRFELEVTDPPAPLAEHLDVPAPVEAVLSAHPDATAAGWTRSEGGL